MVVCGVSRRWLAPGRVLALGYLRPLLATAIRPLCQASGGPKASLLADHGVS